MSADAPAALPVDAIWDKLRRVFAEEFDIEPEALRPEARLVDDLDLDSVDAVALLVRLEEETGLAIEDEGLREIETMQQLVDWLARRLGA